MLKEQSDFPHIYSIANLSSYRNIIITINFPKQIWIMCDAEI